MWVLPGPGTHLDSHQMSLLSHRSTARGAENPSREGLLGKLYLAKQLILYFKYLSSSGAQGKLNWSQEGNLEYGRKLGQWKKCGICSFCIPEILLVIQLLLHTCSSLIHNPELGSKCTELVRLAALQNVRAGRACRGHLAQCPNPSAGVARGE